MVHGTKRRRSSVSPSRKRTRSENLSESEGFDSSNEDNTQNSNGSNANEQSTSDEPKDAITKFNIRWKVGERTDEQILGKHVLVPLHRDEHYS